MNTTRLEPPTIPDPAEAPPLRWGILGPGWIAQAFADALAVDTRQQITAVGSRSRDRAEAFASRWGGRAHGSYQDLVDDAEVDVVYVASPHSEHRDHALLALEAGKPVLVEKSFARNATEAREVLDAAHAKGLFAMEAMWSRFLPHYDVVRRTVDAGALGPVRTVLADHGQMLFPGGPSRLADPVLAGGALLDLGIYPVSFAAMVLGPMQVKAAGTLTELGVDEQVTVAGTTPDGAHAVLSTTMSAKTPTRASVSGTMARIEVDGDFYMPNTVRLLAPDDTVLDTFEVDRSERHQGLRYEACEAARCIHAGVIESPLMTHADTLDVMDLLDEIRYQVGVRYPGE